MHIADRAISRIFMDSAAQRFTNEVLRRYEGNSIKDAPAEKPGLREEAGRWVLPATFLRFGFR
jgi:hypothetical protein